LESLLLQAPPCKRRMRREVPTNIRYKTTKQAKQRSARQQSNETTNGWVRRYMRCNGSKAIETKR